MGVPQLLWRRVPATTMRVLRGELKGQHDIRLTTLLGIERFFAELPREYGDGGSFVVQVPVAATAEPVAVAATSIAVAYDPDYRHGEWRIPSQVRDSAYRLWREGTGLLGSTVAGEDFVVFARDPAGQFHARWLRGEDIPRMPAALAAKLSGNGPAGVEMLAGADWPVVADVLRIDDRGELGVPLPKADADRVGEPYRVESEKIKIALADPFRVDPDVLDRGITAHRTTQNALATYLVGEGRTPLSHRPTVDPPFDVAWVGEDDVLCVAEIKSLTDANQEKQLRLALGQVLRYAHQLAAGGRRVVPVIVAEREPSDKTWAELCCRHGVRLAWPGAFADAVRSVSS